MLKRLLGHVVEGTVCRAIKKQVQVRTQSKKKKKARPKKTTQSSAITKLGLHTLIKKKKKTHATPINPPQQKKHKIINLNKPYR